MKPTLTIGIAAYNEEANIFKLIESILNQDILIADLKEIIIVSDASSDSTDSIITSFLDPRIKFIRHNVRGGVNKAQNRISQEASSDILVVLDADILLPDTSCIEKSVSVFLQHKVDLASIYIKPVKPSTYIESVLAWSHEFKIKLFKKIRKENNIYLCLGPARIFSRQLYKNLQYPDNCPVDAYSYLFATKNNYKFLYIDQTFVWFKLPSTLHDHIKQSHRFASGINTFNKLFSKSTVKKEYTIPKSLVIQNLFKECFIHPVCMLIYTSLTIYVNMLGLRKSFNSNWEIATSSKKLS